MGIRAVPRSHFLNDWAGPPLESCTDLKWHQGMWDVRCWEQSHRKATSGSARGPNLGLMSGRDYGLQVYSQLCPLQAVCPRAGVMTSLSHLFLVCKLGLIAALPLNLWGLSTPGVQWVLHKGVLIICVGRGRLSCPGEIAVATKARVRCPGEPLTLTSRNLGHWCGATMSRLHSTLNRQGLVLWVNGNGSGYWSWLIWGPLKNHQDVPTGSFRTAFKTTATSWQRWVSGPLIIQLCQWMSPGPLGFCFSVEVWPEMTGTHWILQRVTPAYLSPSFPLQVQPLSSH